MPSRVQLFPGPARARAAFALAAMLLSGAALASAEPIGKGNRILIQRGLQIQGLVTNDDVFHLGTYREANYTAINWLWGGDPSKHGPGAGFPWTRWAGNEASMPHNNPAEKAHLASLIGVQLADEQDLNDPAKRDAAVQWFNNVRPHYPNTILSANNFGGQVNDAALADFVARAKPDMISFDTYPWRSDYATRKPAPPAGGSPTNWYGDLRRYREHARQANIPLASYRQTFHAVQDYDATVYRDPSPSELRLNTFAALAFNVKVLVDFTYNTGASSLFTTPGGDSNPTPLFHELKRVNREARNLGKALVLLKPIEDAPMPDLHTTGIVFLRGQHSRDGKAALNDLPVGFVADQASQEYSEWEFGRNDPHVSGWKVTNLGAKNDRLRGDVIVSWFRVLDESLDGDATNEIYVMITNGLCGIDGSADDYRQEITLHLSRYPHETVQRLSRATGNVEEVPLSAAGGKKQLKLVLEGGTCDLIKFKTGAPFVGVQQ